MQLFNSSHDLFLYSIFQWKDVMEFFFPVKRRAMSCNRFSATRAMAKIETSTDVGLCHNWKYYLRNALVWLRVKFKIPFFLPPQEREIDRKAKWNQCCQLCPTESSWSWPRKSLDVARWWHALICILMTSSRHATLACFFWCACACVCLSG